jgi:hypothetical protein
MPSARTLLAAGAALAALAVPATAAAKPHHGGKLEHKAAGHGGRGHKVSLLLRGTWSGGALQVTGGNKATRRAGLVGTTVTLDLASAKLKVRDTDGDGARDAGDLRDGDRVVVQVRVARGDAAEGTLTARKLVARAKGGEDDQGADDADDESGDDSGDDPAEDSGGDA